jgi:hypothetical protein
VLVPDFDGFYWLGKCAGTRNAGGKNCPLDDVATCPQGTTTSVSTDAWNNRGTIRDVDYQVHGTMGMKYTINFDVRGVAGARCYQNGTPASTAAPSTTGPNNSWYVGGVQAGDSIWNTYELRVQNPAVNGKDTCYSADASKSYPCDIYFFNGFPSNPNWCGKEATYQIQYSASFQVMGNSTMEFRIHDSNCQAQQNCGPNDQSTTCDAPRTIDLSGLMPQPNPALHQPVSQVIGTTTFYPQWLYFVVPSITSP